jgi:hypothetical protein
MEFLTSDTLMFPALEIALLGLCVYARYRNTLLRADPRDAGISGSVKRGEISMGKFYAAYGIASGTLIGLALSVEVASEHRTIAVLFNAFVPAYLCLVNGWFRNQLLSGIQWLSERENTS